MQPMSTSIARRLVAVVCLVALSACADLRGVRLPEIGSVGELPSQSDTFRITVLRDGRLFCEGDEVDLLQLAMRVKRAVATRSTSQFEWVECSDLFVLVSADRDAPCGVVGAVLRQLSAPGVYVNRIFFGASSDASGEQGAIALFSPVDLGGSSRDFALQPFRVRVDMNGDSSSPGALVPVLRSWLVSRPSGWEPIVVCESASGVPFGYALQVVDSVLRSGVSKVCIYCDPYLAGEQSTDGASNAIALGGAEAVAVRGAPRMVWNDTVVRDVTTELPPVPFTRGGFSGVSRSFRIVEILELPDFPDEEVIMGDGGARRSQL